MQISKQGEFFNEVDITTGAIAFFFLSVSTLRENDMATEDEEFVEGVFDNDEDDVGAIERSADP